MPKQIKRIKRVTSLKLFVVSLSLALCACTAMPISGVGSLASRVGVGEYASYVQFNEEYAVTVAHYKTVLDQEYVSPQLDIKFFKHKADNGIRTWADYKKGEPIKMAGFVEELSEFKIVDGHLTNETIIINNNPSYGLIEGKITPGMSGGPVLNAQGNIIGINIGVSKGKIALHLGYPLKYYSIFLPSRVIQKEFEEFKASHK